MTNRALVIVGPDGVVRWSHLADSPGDLPGVGLIFDGLRRVGRQLSSAGTSRARWSKIAARSRCDEERRASAPSGPKPIA